jgi:hypothetical protein
LSSASELDSLTGNESDGSYEPLCVPSKSNSYSVSGPIAIWGLKIESSSSILPGRVRITGDYLTGSQLVTEAISAFEAIADMRRKGSDVAV